MDASALGISPQMISMIAAQLQIPPEELMQLIQNNPQVVQQVMEMMNNPQSGGPDDADVGWMDKAAQKQTGAAADETEATDNAEEEAVE
jgi:hypothetical protein